MPYNALELTNIGARIEQARHQRGTRAPEVSPPVLREWLVEAEALQRTQSSPFTDPKLFATWGRFMAELMKASESPHNGVDRDHLAAFLHAANRLEPGELMRPQSTFRAVDDPNDWDDELKLPAYDALALVTTRFAKDTGLGLFLDVLQSQAWEPSILLGELASSRRTQEAYVASPSRGNTSRAELAPTVLGELLLGLHQAMVLTPWRPSQTPGTDREVYGLYWEALEYVDWLHNPDEEEKLAIEFAVALDVFPEHGLKALEFVEKRNKMAEAMLDAILPLSFDLLDSTESLCKVMTILLKSMRFYGGASDGSFFPAMFAEKHPELNALMQLHFSMHSEMATAMGLPRPESVEYLIPGWVAICTKTPVKGMDDHLEGVGALLLNPNENGPV